MTEAWRPVINSIMADWNNGLFDNATDVIERVKDEARQFSAELEAGKTHIFFSGFSDEAEALAMANENAGWIGDTDWSKFIFDPIFQDFLREQVFGGDGDALDKAIQFDLGNPVDEMSRDYARSASGKVIVLSNNARIGVDAADSSILFRTEVPELFANGDVTDINGVAKAAYRNIGTQFLDLTSSLKLIEEQFSRHLIKANVDLGSIDIDDWNNTAQESLGGRFNSGLIEFNAFAARPENDGRLISEIISDYRSNLPSPVRLNARLELKGDEIASIARELSIPLAGAELALSLNELELL